jgi:restriction endonuclease S subunit
MAIAEHIGYDATGRPDKDEFPDVLKAWREFRKTNRISFFVEAPLCFAVGRGEVEGRIDPAYFRPENLSIVKQLKRGPWPSLKFGELIGFIANGIEIRRYVEKGTPYLRVSEMNEAGIDLKNVKFVSSSIETLPQKIHLEENDILISRSGSLGLIALVDTELKSSIISSHIIRVVLSEKCEVNPGFLVYFLRSKYGYSQFLQQKIGAVVPEIDHQSLKSILIPLPTQEIQNKIASMMDDAYKAKKQKESEAENHLKSIESYVLEELGIRIPAVQEKSPKVFSVTADVLKSGRLDPFYFEPKYKVIDEALRKGKYELIEFGKIILEISGGATPKAKGEAYLENAGVPFLRVQNITEEGIKLEDVKYLNERVHNGYLRRSKLKPKDLIFTITGRIGTVAVVPEDFGEGNINQHSVRIHLKEGINERYIASFFNTILGRSLSLRGVSGGTRIALDYEAIKSIRIPLPPLTIQERIANGVQKKREKSKQLSEQAKELLEKAKREVEEFIEKK